MGASWVLLGLPFGASWAPKSAQIRYKRPQDRLKRPKIASRPAKNTIFVSRHDFPKSVEKPKENQHIWLPQLAPNRPKIVSSPAKIGPRWSKTASRRPSTVCFSLLNIDFAFASFWDRFRCILAPLCTPKCLPLGILFALKIAPKINARSD